MGRSSSHRHRSTRIGTRQDTSQKVVDKQTSPDRCQVTCTPAQRDSEPTRGPGDPRNNQHDTRQSSGVKMQLQTTLARLQQTPLRDSNGGAAKSRSYSSEPAGIQDTCRPPRGENKIYIWPKPEKRNYLRQCRQMLEVL